jgi:hypothetical protein
LTEGLVAHPQSVKARACAASASEVKRHDPHGQWCLPLQQQLAFLQLHRKLTSNWATVQAVTQSEHRARTAARRTQVL